MFEVFDHTADIGLRVRAGDLNSLFAEAGKGFFSFLVENLDEVREAETISIKLQSDKLENLYFDWLSELLFIFETRHLLFRRFEVQVQSASLSATAWGEPLDPVRHRLSHEIKAITYHQLSVRQIGKDWVAEVILDI